MECKKYIQNIYTTFLTFARKMVEWIYKMKRREEIMEIREIEEDYNFDPISVGEDRAFITRWTDDTYTVYVEGQDRSTGIRYTVVDDAVFDYMPTEDQIMEVIENENQRRFDLAHP
jgi:hypothetical protein